MDAGEAYNDRDGSEARAQYTTVNVAHVNPHPSS